MSQSLKGIEYYDRATGELCRETVMGEGTIKWAYRTLSGRVFARLLFGTSLPSRILGWYFDSAISKGKINKTISDLNIDASEFAKSQDEFTSFNDFFTRELKAGVRPFSTDHNSVLSPADGRLLVYDAIDGNSGLKVKGVEDTINHLFGKDIDDFNDGKAAVIRLCPADYHRYHFPCEGMIVETVDVKGKYHSVNPIALGSKQRIFCLNKRSYTIIETKPFGRIAYMEVGAFGVAGIHQTYTGTDIKRMQEKGYFDFGGSTIILLFQRGSVEFSSDLLANSAEGVETLVRAGETIATAFLAP